jgi:hypothetical protein
LELLTTRIIN